MVDAAESLQVYVADVTRPLFLRSTRMSSCRVEEGIPALAVGKPVTRFPPHVMCRSDRKILLIRDVDCSYSTLPSGGPSQAYVTWRFRVCGNNSISPVISRILKAVLCKGGPIVLSVVWSKCAWRSAKIGPGESSFRTTF